MTAQRSKIHEKMNMIMIVEVNHVVPTSFNIFARWRFISKTFLMFTQIETLHGERYTSFETGRCYYNSYFEL